MNFSNSWLMLMKKERMTLQFELERFFTMTKALILYRKIEMKLVVAMMFGYGGVILIFSHMFSVYTGN